MDPNNQNSNTNPTAPAGGDMGQAPMGGGMPPAGEPTTPSTTEPTGMPAPEHQDMPTSEPPTAPAAEDGGTGTNNGMGGMGSTGTGQPQ